MKISRISADSSISDTTLSTRLLDSCQLYVAAKKSNLTQWHPLLGWFAQTNCDHAEAMPFVERQLQHLWSRNFVLQVFHCLNIFTGDVEVPYFQIKDDKNSFTKFFWKAMKMDDVMKKGLDKYNTKQSFKLGSHEVTRVVQSAVLYEACLRTLSLLRIDILTSLAFCEDFLMKFWIFLKCLGPQCGLKSFLQLLAVNSKATAPEFLMLQLFGELMNHFLTVTDDVELFEQQKSFTIQDLLMMSQFINVFLVRAIWNGYIDAKSLSTRGPMLALHSLLMTLHKRDLRKTFAPDGFWLSTDPKSSYILLELERNKRHAQTLIQKMPHVIPHADRVILFRYYVVKEKTFLGLTETSSVAPQSTLVTIRRSRLIEDGFRQLSFLSPQATKGIIRIKFINDLGLDEAGIDQDGVFKEFLEETLKRIFDPSLNLFKMTSEQKLYPSPSSYMTENHLELFEFVGRMLGKAVYEGITVDIQFAPFFLHQLLGQSSLAAYSALDDLASLDPDLYRNLTYLKHFDGDVSELQLTFSVDEEVLGRLSTFDIIPGGRATPVTDSNKINYVHQMAHFKLNTQIKDQTQAFLRGFRTVVNPEWLALFSCTELQRLISGDTTGIDFKDLRRNTHYYGGFHDSHRVIQWLWDIVEKELTEVEQRKFLKFVTSCSSPPLLGFGNLEPPFSVRCVEVGDDEDRGDTIGSVLRGFLTLHRKDPVNRLPTASTCFNLLKLPNYQKKATLRDKLKYAIESNSGFELS
ncbi:hypothetical protein QYM36_011849 [Artemia franciscana]|uniref:Ubiquitin-protein ligase E3B n=1 Tax=Artemia franciscana TaxID=6661 RepID=A0AA88KZC5_ARTSF|nr:hypothetical protein QYM36_011849 [Artemia franciscana]